MYRLEWWSAKPRPLESSLSVSVGMGHRCGGRPLLVLYQPMHMSGTVYAFAFVTHNVFENTKKRLQWIKSKLFWAPIHCERCKGSHVGCWVICATLALCGLRSVLFQCSILVVPLLRLCQRCDHFSLGMFSMGSNVTYLPSIHQVLSSYLISWVSLRSETVVSESESTLEWWYIFRNSSTYEKLRPKQWTDVT